MRQTFSLLAVLAIAALASGCANVERKLGRGLSNTFEIVRFGEYRRSVEQSAMFGSPDSITYGSGMVRGFNRTIARTGIGVYEVITCPFPPYGPVFTDHFAPSPVYPDSYKPKLMADSMFQTDASVGFGGGDIAPLVPGSRFSIFETP